jgi:hypothetical protein
MPKTFEFRCRSCGEQHVGLPSRHFAEPLPAHDVPPDRRGARVSLTEDTCTIDDREFYVMGLLEIPVRDGGQALTCGVWLSPSEPDVPVSGERPSRAGSSPRWAVGAEGTSRELTLCDTASVQPCARAPSQSDRYRDTRGSSPIRPRGRKSSVSIRTRPIRMTWIAPPWV